MTAISDSAKPRYAEVYIGRGGLYEMADETITILLDSPVKRRVDNKNDPIQEQFYCYLP
jgi:hypothetical protein